MELIALDPKLILWPENRVTAYYLEGQEELLKESLAGMGQQQPIVVVKVGEEYYGVDGLHRCQSAIERKLATVPCVVKEGDDKDVLMSNLVLNSLRGRTKASEQVNVLGELFNDQGVTIEELEAKTGHSRKWVEDLLLVARAGGPVLQSLDQELITLGHAVALAEIDDQEIRERVCYLLLQYRWSIKELKDHIKNTLRVKAEKAETPAPAEAPTVATTRCTYCGTDESGPRIAVVPVCVSCAGLIVAAVRAAPQG